MSDDFFVRVSGKSGVGCLPVNGRDCLCVLRKSQGKGLFVKRLGYVDEVFFHYLRDRVSFLKRKRLFKESEGYSVEEVDAQIEENVRIMEWFGGLVKK